MPGSYEFRALSIGKRTLCRRGLELGLRWGVEEVECGKELEEATSRQFKFQRLFTRFISAGGNNDVVTFFRYKFLHMVLRSEV